MSLDISAKLTAYHDHNAAARIPQVLGWLEEGQSVALVSDAGTPLVSDPGFKLVRAAVAAGRKRELDSLRVVPATLIFFETGPRIKAALTDMAAILGDRDVVLTRELTKRYEEARQGSFDELILSVELDPPRGELVLLVGPPTEDASWDEARVNVKPKTMSDAGLKFEDGKFWLSGSKFLKVRLISLPAKITSSLL